MAELSIHEGPWHYGRLAAQDAIATHGHARTHPYNVVPTFKRLKALLQVTENEGACVILPHMLIPPAVEPLKTIQQVLATIAHPMETLDLIEHHKQDTLDTLPFDLILRGRLPWASVVLGRDRYTNMRERSAAEQQREARGIGFIAVGSITYRPEFQVGFGDPFTGEHVSQHIPLPDLLASAAKTHGKATRPISSPGDFL